MAIPFGHLLNYQTSQSVALKPISVADRPADVEVNYSPLKPKRESLFSQIYQWLVKPPEVLKVWSRRDRNGMIWWSGYHSITKRSIRNATETEIKLWIERQQ